MIRLFRWCLFALASAALVLSTPAVATANQPPSEPDEPRRASLTYKNWAFTLHTGEGGASPISIAVRHRQGGLETVLRPDRDLDCPEAGGFVGCRSVVGYPRSDSLRGKGMIVHAEVPDKFHPPELIAVLDTGGASGSFSAIGYWRGQAGPWQKDTLNSGSTAIVADRQGRIRVGEPRWESLDWPRAARYPYRSWYKLSPYGRNRGFQPASRKSDHRKELRRAAVTLRRMQRSSGRSARQGQRSVRAVIAAHRKALGQNRQLNRARRSYRNLYGAASLRRLDRGLRRVVRVG